MYAVLNSACTIGVNGVLIRVEIDSSRGFPAFNIVGLPDTAVKESKERVRAAIMNSGFRIPNGHITVNLAPADIKKEGALFDLPIAIGIIMASRQLKIENKEIFNSSLIVGELSLTGEVQRTYGVLPIALAAKKAGFNRVIVPYDNRNEAAFVIDVSVIPVKNIGQLVLYLEGKQPIEPYKLDIVQRFNQAKHYDMDYSDIHGQEIAKRVMFIAAAGGHNILMIGPQGSGKTMLARRLPTILPDLTLEEALETTKIHSIRGLVNKNFGIVSTRPFRSPHHTISDAGMIGGTSQARPGEVSLAHNGVLFLDELPHFGRNVLEALRQPIEDGFVVVSRVNRTIKYPSRFMLVAAMNPCECGHYGDAVIPCTCSPIQIQRYRSKISGPLLDRVDIQIEVSRPAPDDIIYSKNNAGMSSQQMREMVQPARNLQLDRYKSEEHIFSNAQLSGKLIDKYCPLNDESKGLIKQAMDRLGLSARAYDKIRKVARTIADLNNKDGIEVGHIAEALNYRALDKSSYFFGR